MIHRVNDLPAKKTVLQPRIFKVQEILKIFTSNPQFIDWSYMINILIGV